jgi:hypothetical protein
MEKRQSTRALRQRIQPARHLSNIDDNNNSSNSSIIGNHDNDEVIVSIKDRGAGIDPDIQADYSLNL